MPTDVKIFATEDEGLSTKRSSFGKKISTKSFIMVYNLQSPSINKLKILKINDATITAINYGPFDNGYLVLGLSTGLLIIVDIHTMEIIMEV